MWRKWVSALSCALFACCVFAQETLPATEVQLKIIMDSVQTIRRESRALKLQLTESEAQSQKLKAQLLLLDGKLEKAVLSLEKSEADLVQSKEEVEKLKSELQTLKALVNELNRRSRRLETANKILIGVAGTCALAALGAMIYAGVAK